MSVFLLIIGILLFVGLVVFHEFGHFLAARRNGVEVEEFGIGFPPAAWKRKTKKGFVFSLNWLPIGGFVKLKGEADSATEKGSFGAASFKTKTKIMLAGVAMNLLAAFVIFTALAWIGMPQLIDNQFSVKSDTKVVQRNILVGVVDADSPASKAGLQSRDHLEAIGPRGHQEPIDSAAKLPELTKKYAGQEVQINYSRSGQEHVATVKLRTPEEAKGRVYLGLSPAEFTMTRATWSAPVQAAGLTWQFTVATFKGLGTALGALFQGDTTKASEQVSGPVGIVVVLRDGSLLGAQFVLLIIGLISLSLAIMNVLPIPALDGGRFYVLLLSRIFGKRLSQDMEERIVGTSFVFLLLIIVLITIVDVKRFF
ncbi:MAG TPA: M50 family metallopeptidase [Candidatus Pristimantibacillus sp.]|jgi:regulator of sigma E protease|nr:M50 family metallopeptidase [Candidatus Pristimantibacillus sp.]